MFVDEIRAECAKYGPTMHGYDYVIVDNWVDFWAACPLNRELLVQHDSNNREYLSPEIAPAHYQNKFFSGDTYGFILRQNGRPVTGYIMRRVAPDTVEQALRLGKPFPGTALRRLHWDLGIRRITFTIHASAAKALRIIEHRERVREGNVVTIIDRPNSGPGEKEFIVEFTSKPDHRDYDHSDPTPSA